jgi:hypothetical protein
LRDDGEAETFGITFESFDLAVTDEVVVGFSVTGFERGLVAKHVEDDDGELVGGGDDSLGFANFGTHATMVGAEGGVGTQERNGGQAQSMGDTVRTLTDAITQDFAAGFLVMRGEAEPGREMIGRRELMDIGANFSEDNLNGRGTETIHIEEINTGQATKMRVNRFGRGIFGVGVVALLV